VEYFRIFYRSGGHDEIPIDLVLEDPEAFVFMADGERIRISTDEVLTVEDR
jgi:hypothetical protein